MVWCSRVLCLWRIWCGRLVFGMWFVVCLRVWCFVLIVGFLGFRDASVGCWLCGVLWVRAYDGWWSAVLGCVVRWVLVVCVGCLRFCRLFVVDGARLGFIIWCLV